jgi:two-component system CheB/CheR fusion protein
MGDTMSDGKHRKNGLGKDTKNHEGRPAGAAAPASVSSGSPAQPSQPAAPAADPVSDEAIEAAADSPVVMPPVTGIPVVGLGGSAGALDCFRSFSQAMPPDSGAAFVVIQHLAPAHESLLPELLAQHTAMQVAQAEDGVPVEPNRVYVIPPNRSLGIRDGILYLSEPVKQDGIRMPIDFFFRSLAEDRRERAVSVLLSGAGSDGTFGVRAIRGAGGLTVAQDPQTAQYGDMPRNAIATKLVDYVLTPDRMPQAIMEYLRHPYARGAQAEAAMAAEAKPAGFNEILAIVQAQSGCDFRCYKKGTILRRIERRMGLHRIADLAGYGDLLRQDPGEVGQLHKDLLINVTAFFRDADSFEELRRQAIAPMVKAKGLDEGMRIWAPGCASGEEAYSLAMVVLEEMAGAGKSCPVQVFATDIDGEALEFARQGLYPESIATDVGPRRLARFFMRREQGYQVAESLRNCVVFAAQNLITDPPFSKMDLVSCRNLLIYLDGPTQLKLVPLFNFALNPGGYLFLGKSEGVGGQGDLFTPVSKKAKIFRRITPARAIVLDTPILPGRKKVMPLGQPAPRPPTASYTDAIRQALLSHFAAGVVLVDAKGQILQFHGQTGKYLNMPTGEPNLNLLDTAKEGLAPRLRSALHLAGSKGKPVVLDALAVTGEDGAPCARVTVTPLARKGEAAPLLAVIFEEVPRPPMTSPAPAPGEGSESAVRELEGELQAMQQDLQSSIEELQSANEELRVSNEEVVSTNEELQSTNEELETSKEELQSVNEELTTVNSQLQDKVERLDAARSDMANLLSSTQIATLFLDGDLQIKLFTPATTRVLKLIPSDLGRALGDLSTGFVDYDLPADARALLQGGPTLERDVHHVDGSCYRVRVMRYLGQGERARGVVVTFDDVTRLRQAQEQMRRLATVVADSNDAVILFDLTGDIQAWNSGAQRLYGWTEAEALRMNIRDIAPAEEMAIGDVVRRSQAGENIDSYETKRRTKDGRVLDAWLTVTAVIDPSQKVVAIATTERDITARKRAEELLREREEFRRAVLDALPAQVAVLDAGGKVIDGNQRWVEVSVGNNYLDFWRLAAASGQAGAAEAATCIEAVLKGEKLEGHTEYPSPAPGGQRWLLLQAVHTREQLGGAIVSLVDITEHKLAQQALAAVVRDLARSNQDLEQFGNVVSHDLQEPLRMVSGFLTLLKTRYEPQLDDQGKEFIGFAVDGAARMAQLISDLLIFSRVTTRGKKPEAVDTNRPLEAALANLHASIAEAGATVTHDALPAVAGDESQLTQLFQNLIGNAIKFRVPERPCQVHISAQKDDAGQWVFAVRDNGIGIAKEAFDRVFVIFQRLHTRQAYAGTGIGLAICKKIVERHGGKIWVESKPDEGTTFYFTLPAGK